jgi:flagellar biosynthesis/type III secretory pathway protein FliH
MGYECAIKVDRQVASVAVLAAPAIEAARREAEAHSTLKRQQETELQSLRLARKSLEAGAEAISGVYDKMVCAQSQQVAHLAVEIARKILRSRVEKEDYRIEAVVEEALRQAPAKHGVTVRLHPDDLARCKESQEQAGGGPLGAVEFIGDPGVGKAECIIETPKGSIESLLEEHLVKVEEALRSSWQQS